MDTATRQKLLRAHIPCAETGITQKPAVCGLCGGQCLLNVTLREGRVLRTEGNRSLPYQNGKICAKGAALCQWLYHKDRLLYPMRRSGKRGSGQFERISWEEAIDFLCGRLQACKAAPEQTLFYTGHPKWFRTELTALASAYGSPNFGTESSTCFRAMAMGWQASYGTGPAPADMAHCQTLLVWGVNAAYSSTPKAGVYTQLLARGARLVVIDPRITPLCRKAHIHLRPRPGTDGALALGMAHVIVKENLANRAFIETYTAGFLEYRRYLEAFTPERCEELTGVPREDIAAAARLYAQNSPSAIQLSASPLVHHKNGVQNVRAISLLCALTGQYGIKGGNGPPPAPAVQLAGHFLAGGPRRSTRPDLSHGRYPVWSALVPGEIQVTALADYLEGRGAYPVQNLLAFGMNHRMWPNPARLERALGKVGFFANTDLFMTETARYADLLLPAASSLEREQLLVLGGDTLYYQPRVIQPLGEVKSDMEIIQMLAAKMGYREGVLGLASHEEYLRYQLAPTKVSLEQLRAAPEGLKVPSPAPLPDAPAPPVMPTASGKIEFVSAVLAGCGADGLPVYQPPAKMPRYPLTLSTGCRKPQLFHSRTYRLPWLAGLEPVDLAEMHPSDAAALQLLEGEAVWVESPVGRLPLHLRLDTRCLPGVVNLYHGNGERDANLLIDTEYLDPISGFPGYKSYCCRVEKREEEPHVHSL